jgi:hypothetical protein
VGNSCYRSDSAYLGAFGCSHGEILMSKSTHEEHAFEGRAGRTRREFIHWTGEGGIARSAQVYACVNLNSDPKLREGLLSLGVQRGEGGEELLVPLVVHDPALQKLILFLPEALRSPPSSR